MAGINEEQFKYSLSRKEAEIRAMVRTGTPDKIICGLLGLLPLQYQSLRRSAFKKVRLAHEGQKKNGKAKEASVEHLDQRPAAGDSNNPASVGSWGINGCAARCHDTEN